MNSQKASTILPAVVKAAVRLFNKKGIEATSVRDIARAADVADGALYRHFKSKNDLAWWIFSENLNHFTVKLIQRMAEKTDVKDKLYCLISTCFDSFETNRDMFTYLILSEHRELSRYPQSYTHPGLVALQWVEYGQARGEIRSLPPPLAASMVIGTVIRSALVRIYGNLATDLREEAVPVTESLWAGLRVNK